MQCLFPQEIVKNIKTPLFLVHPAYDFWQIRNILVPQGSYPLGHWQSCRRNIHNCDANMIDKLDGKYLSLDQSLKITERSRLKRSERSRSRRNERSDQSKHQKAGKPRHPVTPGIIDDSDGIPGISGGFLKILAISGSFTEYRRYSLGVARFSNGHHYC
ncbi:hypothetical protein V8G54_027710 [Vigna mungo]|uniref:Pectin acetylesterase n=1 Tax=Vigna mungo TaxID=3915 RepID=A0AAQ3N3B9_VIGMU